MGQPDQGHLEIDPRIGCIPHRDLGPSQYLHGPHHRSQSHPFRLRGDRFQCGSRHGGQIGGDQGQETLTEIVDQVTGQLLRAEPGRGQVGHCHQGPIDIPFGEGLDDLVELGKIVVDRVGGDHLVEHGQGVAGRSAAPTHGQVQRLVGHIEVGIPSNLLEQLPERLGTEQPELEVLGPAADGRQHLLRVGGGEHEDDVGGRFLQRLQQGVGSRGREHVDLVDDVDLLAARGPEGGRETRSRMASTPLLEAASSSWTSSEVPLAISTQEVQTPQGSPSCRSVQLSALARIRAVDVLPVPRGPLKR